MILSNCLKLISFIYNVYVYMFNKYEIVILCYWVVNVLVHT